MEGTAMDVQVVEEPVSNEEVEQRQLTFSWLYEEVQKRAGESIYPKPSGGEKWSFRLGLLAAGLGLLAAALPETILPARQATLVAFVCLSVEIGGFLTGWALIAKREWRQYAKPRLSHAREMDADFGHWLNLINELRQFPPKQLEERLRFVCALRQRMNERMGLMYGGLQKLGPFPVLIALYLQFRDWEWGDWAGAFDVNLLGGLLIFAMVLMYTVGWLLVAIRTRLDTYVSLLESAFNGSDRMTGTRGSRITLCES
jgi:hypothetical protein